jgi:phage protein D
MPIYVPEYKIEVQGTALAADVLKDVLSVSCTESINNDALSEIIVNNASTRGNFKYSDSELFVLGAVVVIYMGYQSESIERMFEGTITSVAPRFLRSGPSTVVLSLTGSKRKKRPLRIEDKTLSLSYGKNLLEFNPVNSFVKKAGRPRAQVYSGRGSAIGCLDLKPGTLINLDGVGSAYNGQYSVMSTSHTIDSSGYSTAFTCCRGIARDTSCSLTKPSCEDCLLPV